jgi:hypothetical protein
MPLTLSRARIERNLGGHVNDRFLAGPQLGRQFRELGGLGAGREPRIVAIL